MITTMQMYWLTRADVVVKAALIVTWLSFVLGLISVWIGYMMTGEGNVEDEKAGRYLLNKTAPMCLIASLVCGLVAMFTPTTKEMAAIMIVPRIANSEKVQVCGNKLYDLAVEWMDELRPHKDSKKEVKE